MSDFERPRARQGASPSGLRPGRCLARPRDPRDCPADRRLGDTDPGRAAKAAMAAEISVTSGPAFEVDTVIYSLIGAPEFAVRAKGSNPMRADFRQTRSVVTVTPTALRASCR